MLNSHKIFALTTWHGGRIVRNIGPCAHHRESSDYPAIVNLQLTYVHIPACAHICPHLPACALHIDGRLKKPDNVLKRKL